MISAIMVGLGVLCLPWASVSAYYSTSPSPALPLAVIADSPYSVAKYSVNVPLVTVDRGALPIIRNADISAVSPTRPLVTCRTPQYVTEATPAVQVVLKTPMYITPQQHSIPFPGELSVLYGGLRMGLPVGAVIAPVPNHALDRPHLVRVVYAIPAGPLPLQYPYYDPFAYRAPPAYTYSQTQVLPVAHFQPQSYNPAFYYNPPASALPAPATGLQVSNVIQDPKKPLGKPPTITVLDFPSAVATPEVLYYQPPLDDSELGNRSPPEAIAPAGIVQSTQPVASLESFLNSKESPVLNALREQAEKNKDNNVEGNEGVEAL